jgi:hypothetical protein
MRKRRKNKGPVRSKKVVFDGITFASGLERYMYQALKKAKIKLFKRMINISRPYVTLYKPQNQKECDQVIELITKNK